MRKIKYVVIGKMTLTSTVSKAKIAMLTTIVMAHILFSLSTLVFLLLYSVKIDNSLVTGIATTTATSFVICKRCVAVDIYEFVRGGETELPSVAKDNFFRKNIQKLLNSSTEDLTPLRLDIIENVGPLCVAPVEEARVRLLLNRKIQYIVINSLVIVLLLEKYKMTYLISLFVLWIFYSFSL
jgi:hypothetical protein